MGRPTPPRGTPTMFLDQDQMQRMAQEWDAMRDENASLKAEVERLREALEKRARHHEYRCNSLATTLGDAVPPCSCGVDDARTALAAVKEKP